MEKIVKGKYSKLENIVGEMDWHLSCLAVAEGNNPGNVYVERTDHPEAAFITSPEGCYLVGDPNNKEFNRSLKKLVESEFINGKEDLEIFFLPKWKESALSIFDKFNLRNYRRFHYLINVEEYESSKKQKRVEKIPIQIRSDHVRNSLELKNMQHVKDWILHNWGSYENYDKNGFGYYILGRNRVISWSVCDCRADSRCEIGIWCDPDHRLKGNATVVVQAMLEYAFKHGFKEVGWHCSWDNIGSFKTAEKSGFKREREYLSYFPG